LPFNSLNKPPIYSAVSARIFQ